MFKNLKSRFGICLLLLVFVTSCASYQHTMSGPRNLLKQGQNAAALVKLKELAEKPSDDQLVFLLEYGTALQVDGQYKASNDVFLKADKLADINDFHSVSNIVGASLGSETMIQYKGESYEKVLINAMLAINYLMLNSPEDALIETRRLNEKLTKMRMDGRKPYELNPFAKYLSALIWESDRKFDDAYIAFEEAYKLDPTNPLIKYDLIRAAKNARRDETYKKWKSEFTGISDDPSWYDKGLGELVVIYQQGWGPEKKMAPGQYRFPKLYPVSSTTQTLKVGVSSDSFPLKEQISQTIYDVSQVAITTLNDDYGALVARRVGALASKAVVADQIRQKNQLMGSLAWIAMNVSDQADLRQWSSLPASIQMTKFRLKPGTYKLKMTGLEYSGNPTADQFEGEFKITAGKKTFINYRSLR